MKVLIVCKRMDHWSVKAINLLELDAATKVALLTPPVAAMVLIANGVISSVLFRI